MKLNDYMPPYLSNIREFKQIFSTEDIELENLLLEVNKIPNEIIVKTAESYGLERYEKIYGIKNIAETLEARRVAILLKINSNVPYTYNWLIKTLNEAIGKENYKIETDFKNYKMLIHFRLEYTEAAEMLNQNLIKQIPANIKMDIDLFAQTTCYIGANIRQVSYEKIDTCIETISEREAVNGNKVIGINLREQTYMNIKVNNEIHNEEQIIDTKASIGAIMSRQDYINIEEVEK
jgi:hypothetical protein|nr:MAG TPA: tail protein [Caudoviricetes sp.]